MLTLLTTSKIHPRDSFRFWQAALFERVVPVELKKIGFKPFEGTLEGVNVGPLTMTRVTQSAIRTEATPGTIRQHDKHETVSVVLMLSGTLACAQGGRESVQRPGEFVVLDRKPTVMETKEHSRSLIVEVPRERLERMLGPVSQYAGLTVGSNQVTTSLVTNFIDELTRIQGQLSPDLAERLSGIGIDLLVAGLSERMAREAPRPLAGTLLIQRAKAYVAANLGDPTLDPSQLAIAMGVSLRRLQQLFQEHGENIGSWIWQRRLELAASRLSDSGCIRPSLAALAYDCGFISQSHFSKRFKDRYGMTPGEYRASAIGMR
ncbi:helix-turn-helix domain-containing protein [Methylobacterium sp. HMF5984]|uniref:helix-turn-helix domain-containing protein n=1 Tax=Methylobacterium sp. HMF5984 TaxID=3367370 RepID=UPI0038524046